MNTGLFIVLFILGGCFLFSLFLDYRRKAKENYLVDQNFSRADNQEKNNNIVNDLDLNLDIAEPVNSIETGKSLDNKNYNNNIIMLHIHAKEDQEIAGDKLLRTLLRYKLRYGRMKIFHYYDENKQELFSISSIANPGFFDIANMAHTTFPGISLFFVSDNVVSPGKSYTKMFEIAKKMADDLGSEILDENHELLSAKKIANTVDKLKEQAEAILVE